MTPRLVGPEVAARLDWIAVSEAIAAGHLMPRAEIGDTFLYRGADTMLSRAAWIDGLGLAVKTATIFPANPGRGLAAVNGALCLYDDRDGRLAALVDFHLVTRWKTAADSLLAARRLARPEARAITLVGAGNVAAAMAEAYAAAFPGARFTIWNRSPGGAARLAAAIGGQASDDLEAAVRGAWLRPGQHLDLIGAYRPDMREVDDDALARARLFVDSRETTLAHIGELKDPLSRGVIAPGDVIADFYEPGLFARRSDDEITLAKNGGGAHLDLMVARHILDVVG